MILSQVPCNYTKANDKRGIMKIYQMEYSCISREDHSTCTAVFDDPNIEKEYPAGIPFTLGEPLQADIPTPIRFELDKQLPLDDYLYTSNGEFLVTDKLFQLIKCSCNNFKSYESEIIYKDKLVLTNCKTINFEQSFSVMDWEKSNFEEDPDFPKEYVSHVRKLVIDTSKVPKDEHIFRLKEASVYILATDKFKQLIEKENITGISFIELEQ